MVHSLTLLLLTLEFTEGYSDGFAWKLALNINPADGHISAMAHRLGMMRMT